MKHIIIILLTFLAFSLNAQEKQEKKVPIQKMKSASIEKNVETKTLHTENKPIYVSSKSVVKHEKTVEYYDNYIKALETKIAYIKADENENAKAIETGWYDEMNLNIKKAKAEKFNLENKNR